MKNNPFVDRAEPVLRAAPTLTDSQRADLWDTFAASKDHHELGERLQHAAWADVPASVKLQLYDAKQASVAPPTDPVDRVIHALSQLPRVENLDRIENHPALDTITNPEKLG